MKTSIETRIRSLRTDSPRQWGSMSVDQMLWHVNEGLEVALGIKAVASEKMPLPGFLMKFVVLNLPWSKGLPTVQAYRATSPHDFEVQRGRCLRLVQQFVSRNLDEPWPPSPFLGKMSGRDTSRLQAKHLNHHLRQFGA